jgi:hypothetical protein
MSRRKIAISLLLAAVLVINAISLGWAVANNETADIAILAIQVGFSVFLVVLAFRSVNLDTPNAHSRYILHLTSLSTIATALLGTTVLLPDTPPLTASNDESLVLRRLQYARLALYALVCLITITTPLGPPLHYRPEDIYSEKTVQTITNTTEENVSGSIGKFSGERRNLL